MKTPELFARRPTIGGAVSAVLWALLIAYAALVTHDFYRHVNHWVYLSVDDGLANEAYTLASQGRYGFLSSPVLFAIERHHGEFSYGPWYFYLAGGLIWLFGYSLTLIRSIHLWVILGSVAAASYWFRGPGRAAAANTFGLVILYAFAANQWPMARPDSLVSLFAIVLVACAGLGLTRGGARFWFGAGLAASCGAFTHLIAASLVPSSIVLFIVAAVHRWPEADDRARARKDLLTAFTAFAFGGLLGAVMFYASFGFRLGDQLRLFTAYRELVASTDGYRTVAARHLFVAFRYFSPQWALYVTAVIVAAWSVVALAGLLSRHSRTLIFGYLLPPITVWTGYIVSNGWYTNQHKGYAILHEVLIAWVLASLVWIGISLIDRRTSRLARAVPALIGLLLVVQGVRQIGWHLEAAASRAASVSQWVLIDDYVDHVLSHIPRQSTAWGSVMFGIETPDRLQLIQVEDALRLMDRVHPSRRAALAPDYLVWGYSEERDSTLGVLRGGDSRLGKLAQLTDNTPYRVASLVAAAPYGVTRVYAKTDGPGNRTPPLPDVSIFDAGGQRWLSRVGLAIPLAFTPTAPAEFAIRYTIDPRPARAARTLSAVVPPGRYLVRLAITPGAGATNRRLLAATSREMRQQRVSELGPQGDFTSYFGSDRHVVMLTVHGGGPLDISQFDDGAGAGIDSVEVFPIAALLDPGEEAGVHPLPVPTPAVWTPTKGLRHTTLPSGAVTVEGDASRSAIQITSPKMLADIGDSVTVHLDTTVNEGRACLGVLNGTKTAWLVSPDRPRIDATFREDESRGFHLVSANCNDADTGNAATRITVFGGTYTVEPAMLYTDRLMGAVDAKAIDPADTDLSGAMPGLSTVPPDLKVTGSLLNTPAPPLSPGDLAFTASIVRANGGGWIIAGRAESAYSYLLQSKPRSFDQSARLIVTGTVEKGGLTVGLLSNGAWAAQLNVTEPGPFTVVIAAPRNGAYSILLANALPGSLDTSIAITKLGIVHAP